MGRTGLYGVKQQQFPVPHAAVASGLQPSSSHRSVCAGTPGSGLRGLWEQRQHAACVRECEAARGLGTGARRCARTPPRWGGGTIVPWVGEQSPLGSGIGEQSWLCLGMGERLWL